MLNDFMKKLIRAHPKYQAQSIDTDCGDATHYSIGDRVYIHRADSILEAIIDEVNLSRETISYVIELVDPPSNFQSRMRGYVHGCVYSCVNDLLDDMRDEARDKGMAIDRLTGDL